jgi:hypothetical protein
MKRITILVTILVLLFGCTNDSQSKLSEITATPQVVEVFPTANKPDWAIYDPDPKHLWNRVFREFYRRVAVNGQEYGADELDPLLWFDTTYLLNGTSYQQALQVLDEFLVTHADDLVREPLKRAMFQHDLWAVFDWAVSQPEPYSSERQALAKCLAQIIRRVALSKEEILSLPDNYALEIKAKTFPTDVSVDNPETAFLPIDIFQPDSAWLPVGREGGPIAMTHTESFPFFGRSVFMVYFRSSGGRGATLDYIDALNTNPSHALTIDSDVALVRRMLLVDDQGNLILAPLVESIQIRNFSPVQFFHEFIVSRTNLLHDAGGLVLKADEFLLFMSHGDVFEIPDLPLKASIPQICKACHFENPPLPNPSNTQSIISYSRYPFSLSDNSKPVLFATTLIAEAQTVIEWKYDHETWISLESLWNQTSP